MRVLILSIAFGTVVLIALILAILMFVGKGAFILSGYNYVVQGDRAKKCELFILRRAAWFLIGISIGLTISYVLLVLELSIAAYIVIGLTGVEIICGVFYLAFSDRLARAEFLAYKFSEDPNYLDEYSKYDGFLKLEEGEKAVKEKFRKEEVKKEEQTQEEVLPKKWSRKLLVEHKKQLYQKAEQEGKNEKTKNNKKNNKKS